MPCGGLLDIGEEPVEHRFDGQAERVQRQHANQFGSLPGRQRNRGAVGAVTRGVPNSRTMNSSSPSEQVPRAGRTGRLGERQQGGDQVGFGRHCGVDGQRVRREIESAGREGARIGAAGP